MIYIMKLVSGEELIADVTDAEGGYDLKQPCILQVVPSRTNPEQPVMALIPYATYTENHKVFVSSSHVVWASKPVEELYNQYNSIFGTGIMLPT